MADGTINEWAQVLLSDEPRFCLESSDRRGPNERRTLCPMQHSWKAALRRWLGYGLAWCIFYCSYRFACISQRDNEYHLPHLSRIISFSSMIMHDCVVSELCPSIWTKSVLLLCNDQQGIRTLTRYKMCET
jgi:hypothetical protein